MARYTDNNGKSRHLEITIGAVRRAKSRCGVDLYNIMDIGSATEDMESCLRLIYHIQNDDKDEDGLESWFAEHKGEATDSLIEAFLEEIVNFLPSRLANQFKIAQAAATEILDQAFAILDQSNGKFGELPERLEFPISAN